MLPIIVAQLEARRTPLLNLVSLDVQQAESPYVGTFDLYKCLYQAVCVD